MKRINTLACSLAAATGAVFILPASAAVNNVTQKPLSNTSYFNKISLSTEEYCNSSFLSDLVRSTDYNKLFVFLSHDYTEYNRALSTIYPGHYIDFLFTNPITLYEPKIQCDINYHINSLTEDWFAPGEIEHLERSRLYFEERFTAAPDWEEYELLSNIYPSFFLDMIIGSPYDNDLGLVSTEFFATYYNGSNGAEVNAKMVIEAPSNGETYFSNLQLSYVDSAGSWVRLEPSIRDSFTGGFQSLRVITASWTLPEPTTARIHIDRNSVTTDLTLFELDIDVQECMPDFINDEGLCL